MLKQPSNRFLKCKLAIEQCFLWMCICLRRIDYRLFMSEQIVVQYAHGNLPWAFQGHWQILLRKYILQKAVHMFIPRGLMILPVIVCDAVLIIFQSNVVCSSMQELSILSIQSKLTHYIKCTASIITSGLSGQLIILNALA